MCVCVCVWCISVWVYILICVRKAATRPKSLSLEGCWRADCLGGFFWFCFGFFHHFFIVLTLFPLPSISADADRTTYTLFMSPNLLHLHTPPHSHTGIWTEQKHSTAAATTRLRSSWRWDVLIKVTLTWSECFFFFFSYLERGRPLLIHLTCTFLATLRTIALVVLQLQTCYFQQLPLGCWCGSQLVICLMINCFVRASGFCEKKYVKHAKTSFVWATRAIVT